MSCRTASSPPTPYMQEDNTYGLGIQLEVLEPRPLPQGQGHPPALPVPLNPDTVGEPSITDGHTNQESDADADEDIEEAAESPGRCRCCLPRRLRTWFWRLYYFFHPGRTLEVFGGHGGL
jgi:hypothetical protein